MRVIGLDMSASVMSRRGGPDKLWGAANSLLDQFGEDTVVIGFSCDAGVLKPAGASRAALSQNFHRIRPGGTDTKVAIQLAASLVPGCTLHMITDGQLPSTHQEAARSGIRVQEHLISMD